MAHYYIADRACTIRESDGTGIVRGTGTLTIPKGGTLVVDDPVTVEGLREVTQAELDLHCGYVWKVPN